MTDLMTESSEHDENTGDSHVSLVDTQIRNFWHEIAFLLVKETLPTVEEAIKQTTSTIGLLIGFYISAIAFSDLRSLSLPIAQILLFVVPLIFWFIGLVFNVVAGWTRVYGIRMFNAKLAKETWENMVKRKQRFNRIANIFMLLGVCFAIFSIAIYLLNS